MARFQDSMQSAETQQRMGGDGVKPETLRMLSEFTSSNR